MGHEVILSGFYSRFFGLQENGTNRQFSLPTASLVCCLLSTLQASWIFCSETESSKTNTKANFLHKIESVSLCVYLLNRSRVRFLGPGPTLRVLK